MSQSDIDRTKALIAILIEAGGIANKFRSMREVSDYGQRADLHIRIALRALKKAVDVLEKDLHSTDSGEAPVSAQDANDV